MFFERTKVACNEDSAIAIRVIGATLQWIGQLAAEAVGFRGARQVASLAVGVDLSGEES